MTTASSILVMVDEILVWPHAKGVFKQGSCHLTVNGESKEHLDALHEMALKIGLKRKWFQKNHYDLTPSKRSQALAAGAVHVDAMEQARQRIDRRRLLVDEDSKKPGPGEAAVRALGTLPVAEEDDAISARILGEDAKPQYRLTREQQRAIGSAAVRGLTLCDDNFEPLPDPLQLAAALMAEIAEWHLDPNALDDPYNHGMRDGYTSARSGILNILSEFGLGKGDCEPCRSTGLADPEGIIDPTGQPCPKCTLGMRPVALEWLTQIIEENDQKRGAGVRLYHKGPSIKSLLEARLITEEPFEIQGGYLYKPTDLGRFFASRLKASKK